MIPTPLSQQTTYYGKFGGIFMPESLIEAMNQLANQFAQIKKDDTFNQQLNQLLSQYAGRETPLTEVKRFQQAAKGPRLFLKREDMLHTGAHKINNVLGQCLLAKKFAKQRIIAETGAGQHGVATATVCARLDLPCTIYMGSEDMQRQRPNVEKMRLLGAEVKAVDAGCRTLKEAVNEALRDYAANFATSHYCLGSALGPYPYPQMVAHFQAVIGKETAQQCQQLTGQLPDVVIAAIGGGSNAIGIFSAFIDNPAIQLVGVEGGGHGQTLGQHAARFQGGQPGVLHGCLSYLLQDSHGQVANTASISAGLDYPMIGPQHADLYESGRAHYTSASDSEALQAFKRLSQCEGIIPALESSHALAYYLREAKNFSKEQIVVVNLSGRGDKDLPQLFAQGAFNE
ncbi:MAG: tryptophan synthase subunit beta [Gammaproteobacteria bacterium]|nr:tryptophan synthase subunit beta [Gammaproteobacteria bacterium]